MLLHEHLFATFLDGALLRSVLATGLLGRSTSWYYKTKNEAFSVKSHVKAHSRIQEFVSKKLGYEKCLDLVIIQNDQHYSVIQEDANIEYYERITETKAPLLFYVTDNAVRNLLDAINNTEETIIKPYCYMWGWGDSVSCSSRFTVDYAVLILACCTLELVHQTVAADYFSREIRPCLQIDDCTNFTTSRYVNKVVEEVKRNGARTLESFYQLFADHGIEFPDDPESVKKLIQRWRTGDTKPSLKKLISFINLCYVDSQQALEKQYTYLFLLHCISYLQTVREKPLFNAGAYDLDKIEERFSYWIRYLSDHYIDVIEARSRWRSMENTAS